MKTILAILVTACAVMLSGCLDNARTALASYCDGADKAIAYYADWDDLTPAQYRGDVDKTIAASNKLCASPSTVTPRQAYDIAADLYRSLEIARAHIAPASAWTAPQRDSIIKFDSIMRRAKEAGLK